MSRSRRSHPNEWHDVQPVCSDTGKTMANTQAGERVLWRAALSLQEEDSQGLHEQKDQICSQLFTIARARANKWA
jgi:hypothetical protein